MRNFFFLFITLLYGVHATAWSGTIYKCKTADGDLHYQEKPCAEKAKSVSSWGSASGSTLVLPQGNGGHYFVDGTINDHKLNFVIDTGASVVVIPQSQASQAGLICQKQTMTHTANGLTPTCRTTIHKLKFGTFTLTNVEASIAPNLGQPLMGMNVLKQFRVEQDSGEMRLLPK